MTWRIATGERFWPNGDYSWPKYDFSGEYPVQIGTGYAHVTPENYGGPGRFADGGFYSVQQVWRSDIPGNPDVPVTTHFSARHCNQYGCGNETINDPPPPERLPNGQIIAPPKDYCTALQKAPPPDMSLLPPASAWAVSHHLATIERKIAGGVPLTFDEMAVLTVPENNPWRVGAAMLTNGWIPYENSYNQFACTFIPEKYQPGNASEIWASFVQRVQNKESGGDFDVIAGSGITVKDYMAVSSLVGMGAGMDFGALATEVPTDAAFTASDIAPVVETYSAPAVVDTLQTVSDPVPLNQFDVLDFGDVNFSAMDFGDLTDAGSFDPGALEVADISPDVATYADAPVALDDAATYADDSYMYDASGTDDITDFPTEDAPEDFQPTDAEQSLIDEQSDFSGDYGDAEIEQVANEEIDATGLTGNASVPDVSQLVKAAYQQSRSSGASPKTALTAAAKAARTLLTAGSTAKVMAVKTATKVKAVANQEIAASRLPKSNALTVAAQKVAATVYAQERAKGANETQALDRARKAVREMLAAKARTVSSAPVVQSLVTPGASAPPAGHSNVALIIAGLVALSLLAH